MAILIFDQNCPYCKATAKVTSAISDIELLEYGSEEAQKMLDEAFEDPGFTLYFFEDDRVYWGQEAARKAAEGTPLPEFTFLPILRSYPYIVKLFSVLSRRTSVNQPVCNADRCMATEEGGGMKKLKKKGIKDRLLEFVR